MARESVRAIQRSAEHTADVPRVHTSSKEPLQTASARLVDLEPVTPPGNGSALLHS